MFARLARGRRFDRERAPGPFELDRLGTGRRSENQDLIRQQCNTAFIDGYTSLCRVLGRYKMFVDPADYDLSNHLMLDGYWEMWVTEAIPRFVRPGMTTIDVGANLGYYTLLLADLVGPAGAVHAFEPNSPVTERLRRTILLNGFDDRVHVHGCALSDQDKGQVNLVAPRGRPAAAYVLETPAEGAGSTALRVEARRLDGFRLPSVDFIKIDAEASEERIWAGMTGLLERSGAMTVFLEFATPRYASPAAFLGRLLHYGFSLARVEPSGGVRAIDEAAVLAHPPTEQMLVLRR
jgi:FkbM family methyltransferase